MLIIALIEAKQAGLLSKSHWVNNILAGMIVGVVVLELAMAFAIANPLIGLPNVNLKATCANARNIKQVGMSTALKIVGLKLDGDHHRALADAQNIARLMPWSPY